MKLVFCPSCGTVYVEGTESCTSKKCEETETWCPPLLQPVEGFCKCPNANIDTYGNCTECGKRYYR